MKAYRVSKNSDLTIEEKIELVKSYNAGELLKVLREFESEPDKYEPIIIQGVVGRLYDMGIKCI